MHHPVRIPPIALLTLLLAVCLAGCGSDGAAPAETAAPPAETAAPPAVHKPAFEPGHAKAVRDYYGAPHTHGDDDPAPDGIKLDTEEEYHQPPRPATGHVGDTITLTGINLGVRMDVTVTGVKARRRTATVGLRLENSGIAIFESTLAQSVLVDGDGRRARVAAGVKAPCSNGFHDVLRIDVGRKRSGCLVYATPRGFRPERLQLALEQVPAAAGGRWSLR
jgi:hypothetical protein